MNSPRSPRRWYCSILLSMGLACGDAQPVDNPFTDSGTPPTSSAEGTTGVDITTSGIGTATEVGTAEGSDGTDDATDTVADTTTGGCTGGCDDGIACTEDECVDGACVNTPMDTMCDDGVDCTMDTCDAAMDCVYTPVDVMCDDGIDCTADTCDAAAGCVATPDDLMCDDGVMCTTNACDAVMGCVYAPDDLLCDDAVGCTADVCDPVMDCQSTPNDALCDDGLGCTTDTCDAALDCQYDATVLVFNGSNGASTAPEDAVVGLGLTPIVVTDEAGFVAAYDAGGFGAIVFDVPSVFTPVPAAVQTRLDSWVAGGDRLIFGFWDLDVDAAMRATLGVTVTASFNSPQPIFPDPGAPVDLFDATEMVPSPISYSDHWGDNGDEIAPSGAGFIAGRFNSGVGPGAIVVTNADRVITNGFMISEIGEFVVDSDGDGINDGEELLRNEIEYICAAP